MKKLLSGFLCIIFLAGSFFGIIPVNAEISDNEGILTKKEFADYCDSLNERRLQNTDLSQSRIDQLLYLYAINDNKEHYESVLNAAGIYIYNAEKESDIMSMSQPGDINLSGVIISYDSNTGDWALTVGGSWNNLSAISKDSGTWWDYSLGRTRNIGGMG